VLVWLASVALVALTLWFGIEKTRRHSHSVAGGIDTSVNLPHECEFELYSNSFSHCSRKTRLVMDELGLEYRYHSIDLIETGWYQTISPEYLKVNPAGLLPTLVHNGHPVYESDYILTYAVQATGSGSPKLAPNNPALLDEMNRWLDFCSISSGDPMGEMAAKAGACIPGLTLPLFVTAIPYIPLRNILIGFLFHSDKKRPAFFSAAKLLGVERMMSQKPVRQLARASRDFMSGHLRTINVALTRSNGDWILGNAFSLADITIGCLLLRLEETGWLAHFTRTQNLDHVERFFEKLKARPSWRTAIDERVHPIIESAKLDLAEATSRDEKLYHLIYSG